MLLKSDAPFGLADELAAVVARVESALTLTASRFRRSWKRDSEVELKAGDTLSTWCKSSTNPLSESSRDSDSCRGHECVLGLGREVITKVWY